MAQWKISGSNNPGAWYSQLLQFIWRTALSVLTEHAYVAQVKLFTR